MSEPVSFQPDMELQRPNRDIDKDTFGQFFTKDPDIQQLVQTLTQNSGEGGVLLEPAAGQGDLIPDPGQDPRPQIAVEVDPELSDTIQRQINREATRIIQGCFFQQGEIIKEHDITTIVSNPPYVSLRKYLPHASEALKAYVRHHDFPKNGNLAYPFMLRCAELLVEGGEMIFIVPKDLAIARSAESLRQYLKQHGYFTHWVDAGEKKHFDDADLETLTIFRWQKGQAPTGRTSEVQFADSVSRAQGGLYTSRQQLYCGEGNVLFFGGQVGQAMSDTGVIGDYFNVRVSSVTGADEVFRAPEELCDLECAHRFKVGPEETRIYLNTNEFERLGDMPDKLRKYLLDNKKRLMSRYNAREEDWWTWSTPRNTDVSLGPSGKPRIWVHTRTRQTPFEVGEDIGFSGRVFAMFPHDELDLEEKDLENVVNILTSSQYQELFRSSGFAVNDKFKANPRSLEAVPLPPPEEWAQVANLLEISNQYYKQTARLSLTALRNYINDNLKSNKLFPQSQSREVGGPRQESNQFDNELSAHFVSHREGIKQQINELLATVEALAGLEVAELKVPGGQKATTTSDHRTFYDLALIFNNGWKVYINNKYIKFTSNKNNVGGGLPLVSYILLGPERGRCNSLEPLMERLDEHIQDYMEAPEPVDYFVLALEKTPDGADEPFDDILFGSIFDGDVVVNSAQSSPPGLQINIQKTPWHDDVDIRSVKRQMIDWLEEYYTFPEAVQTLHRVHDQMDDSAS